MSNSFGLGVLEQSLEITSRSSEKFESCITVLRSVELWCTMVLLQIADYDM